MKEISVNAAMRSGVGLVRSNNEDAWYFNGEYSDLHPEERDQSESGTFRDGQMLFAVCDGMGGHENGEYASNAAVVRMKRLQEDLKTEDFPGTIRQWVTETNDIITGTADGGGCTLALLYLQNGKLQTAHLGDSRIYQLRNGAIRRLTKDHSRVQMLMDAGAISPEEARSHPQRHMITRALGMDEEENGQCVATLGGGFPVEAGDRYLICSDGVTDMLRDAALESFLQKGDSAAECAEQIFRAAMEAGGRDNTTLIVLEILGAEKEPAGPDGEEDDPLESTWRPDRPGPAQINVEQVMTIQQEDGRRITIRSTISSGQPQPAMVRA